MSRKIGFIIFTFLVATFVVFKTTKKETPDTPSILVKGNTVFVSLAKTPAQITKGLGGTTNLPHDHGMLFIFPNLDQMHVFWMKDMLIPIDIIWINDGAIVQIDENIQAPLNGTPDNELTKYPSFTPVDYVLEVNAGFSQEKGLKVGDTVDLLNIR